MLSRVPGILVAVTLLTGCGFAQSNRALPNVPSLSASNMKGRNLLYASTSGDEALYVYSEFQVVPSGHFAEIVEVGVVLILARLWSVCTEPQCKIPIDIDEGQRAGRSVLGNDVEPE